MAMDAAASPILMEHDSPVVVAASYGSGGCSRGRQPLRVTWVKDEETHHWRATRDT